MNCGVGSLAAECLGLTMGILESAGIPFLEWIIESADFGPLKLFKPNQLQSLLEDLVRTWKAFIKPFEASGRRKIMTLKLKSLFKGTRDILSYKM